MTNRIRYDILKKIPTFADMKKKLYIFNPENDMALASGSPYYMAPASAKKMAADLATLPAWYAEAGSRVFLADVRQLEWMTKGCQIALPVQGVTEMPGDGFEVMPWGWSPALLHRMADAFHVPIDMESVRRLSGRRTAVDLLPKLRMENTVGESFWLTSVDEIGGFVPIYNKVLLKAPWSGSGKGIQPLSGQPDDNLKGWARRIIASQGGVVCEPYYNKVEDFAMEFLASSGGVTFAGYSFFEADARGLYKENWLASDEAIENRLSMYVSGKVLGQVRERLLHELPLLLGDAYQGYLGVDMMIVRTEDGYAVHPCVEINLRMNMGVVSRLFFDRYVCPESSGRYMIEYYPHEGDALRFHEAMKREHPLYLRDGKIKEGYLSLTPVFGDTAYQIYVLIMGAKERSWVGF